MTKIEEIENPKTGLLEVFLNDKRVDTLENDQTNIQLEILKNLVETIPAGESSDEERNQILQMISNHLGDGNNSLVNIKDVLESIYHKIDGGNTEEIERVKKELLLLIHLLEQKIEEQKLVAGRGIIIEGNVISTTEQSHLDEVIELYEKLKAKYKELQHQYELVINENTQLKSTIQRLQREINSLKEQLDKIQKDCTDKISELKNYYEKIISNNNTTILELNKEIERLKKIIDDSETASTIIQYQEEAEKWKKQYELLEDQKYANHNLKTDKCWDPCKGDVSPRLMRQVCMSL